MAPWWVVLRISPHPIPTSLALLISIFMAWRYVKGLSIPDRARKGWMRFETVWLDK